MDNLGKVAAACVALLILCALFAGGSDTTP